MNVKVPIWDVCGSSLRADGSFDIVAGIATCTDAQGGALMRVEGCRLHLHIQLRVIRRMEKSMSRRGEPLASPVARSSARSKRDTDRSGDATAAQMGRESAATTLWTRSGF